MRFSVLMCLVAATGLHSVVRGDGAAVPAALVEPALAIHAALAADITTGVASQAAALASGAGALGPAALPIAAAAQDLAAQTDLTAARRAYGDLSKALVAYMRAETLALPDGVRPAYCPMARRPWIQKHGLIRNPYYGGAMSSCGDFTD